MKPALLLWVLLLLLLPLEYGCAPPARSGKPPSLVELRRTAAVTSDPELAGRWLLRELISPGGEARHARTARARLDRIGGGRWAAHLARGLDDAVHGRLSSAPTHYLRAAQAARSSSDLAAPFVAWFSVHEALRLREQSPGLWKQWEGFVRDAMREPSNLGWRARAELVEWWADEEHDKATRDVEELAAKEFGCARHVQLAGPFGRQAPRDVYRRFPPEHPGPWPQRWARDASMGESPRVLETDRHGCTVFADEPVGDGVFYAQTFVTVPADREALIAVQGALAVWVDDTQVVDRDPRRWGVWPSFGAQLWLRPGRHRILARLTEPRTSIRIMHPDGRPLKLPSSADSAPAYGLVPPQITRDPNLLSRFIRNGDVVDPGDDVLRLTAAYLAYLEDEADAASLIMEPLVRDLDRATGAMLALAGTFAASDPIFDESQSRDLARRLHEAAAGKDPSLWRSRLTMALWEGEQGGAPAAVRQLRPLVDEFPEAPAVLLALTRLYGKLGWRPEYSRAVKQLAERFPDMPEALLAAIDIYDDEGATKQADALVERVRLLDPDSEVALSRALARQDYDAALEELGRLGKRRPDRKDIAERVHAVMARAGNTEESWKQLQAAIERDPRSGRARLALADARFATGDHSALSLALVDAVESGASTDELKAALDLVEGMTELEPYRIDARSVIAAYEQTGRHLPGTAARVLDYAAVWAKADGSSRMLEHEVVRIQSPEAATGMAEHRRLPGLALHMRVLKQDGRVLEPEFVAGKPTVTFPHLEVGDYIETEQIISLPGDGQDGTLYVGPHWFFREENVAYARSEFVVISPASKHLIVETRGQVPDPKREDTGAFEVRRWRVDESPASPTEPNSPPITEFLPSVRVGWGVELSQQIQRYADSVADLTPVDPRIRRIARRIVKGVPKHARTERARRLYRWVLANVEEGDETDGRRVIIGKHGVLSRGFATLCRAVGIRVDYAIARNRLAPPPAGPISQATEFTLVLLRIAGDDGRPVWLTVGSKYAPFGYVPAEARDVPAWVLAEPRPSQARTPAGGTQDAIDYLADVVLASDGSATVELVQRFHGRQAVGARQDLAQLPENRLPDVLQSLVGRALSGASLIKHSIEHLDSLDSPLELRMKIRVPAFARRAGGELILSPPFTWSVARLASLPQRQTPLLITTATHEQVKLSIRLPKGARLASTLAAGTIRDGERYLEVADTLKSDRLVLHRVVHIPAGRVQPERYPEFVQFARRADDAQASTIRISLGD